MLKIEVNKGDARITAGGDLREVVADFCIAIHHVYNILHKDAPEAAMAFAAAMQISVLDPKAGIFEVTGVEGEGMSMIIPVENKE